MERRDNCDLRRCTFYSICDHVQIIHKNRVSCFRDRDLESGEETVTTEVDLDSDITFITGDKHGQSNS